MKQYQELIEQVLREGQHTKNRTEVDTISMFGTQMRFPLMLGFPLVTTKKIHFKSVVHELLWFIKGDTNTRYLTENGVRIWNEWADEKGDLGPVYGFQWRKWPKDSYALDRMSYHADMEKFSPYIDQLAEVIANIKSNPTSRRLIISAWNPSHLPIETLSPQENVSLGRMALAPCHAFMQFNTRGPYLDLHMYQRSVDVFLGLPFNIASYSLLLMMVAQVTGMVPGNFIWTGGDTHLYVNHIEQAREIITREPKPLPEVILNEKVRNIDDFKYEDITLLNYEAHPHIKADIAV